jgi:hypothetical protein
MVFAFINSVVLSTVASKEDWHLEQWFGLVLFDWLVVA